MVTREAIEERLATARSDYEAVRVRMIMLDGVIQDCEHWLAVCDAQDATATAPAPAQVET